MEVDGPGGEELPLTIRDESALSELGIRSGDQIVAPEVFRLTDPLTAAPR